MNEHVAAVIVACVTGVFGFAGILVTQLIAHKRTKKISPSEPAEVAAALDKDIPPRLDYLAALKHEVRENGILAREQHSDIKQGILDVKLILREHAVEDKIMIEEVLSRLPRHKNDG